MGPSSARVTYSGWNLDDVQIVQVPGGRIERIVDDADPDFSVVGSRGTSRIGESGWILY